ncbi:MAG: HlyD family efflux transporter periplasmic adaptor subunit [Rhodospirillales bacterium]|nr:HlyD family efflux transporter periplasmic adaptor subunit [Rhodospirillales bacterium]
MASPLRWLLRIAVLLVAGGVAYGAWQALRPNALPPGFALGNGRLEAVEIDIATKTAGRVKEIVAEEGDFVTAGQVLAFMDTDTLLAQRREAEAQLRRATIAVETARSQVTQREAERTAALALVAQREAEQDAAQRRFARSAQLAPHGTVPEQRLDDDRAQHQAAQAAVSLAKAQVAAAEAALGTARSEVIGAQSAVEATRATIERIQVDIDDSVLKAPRDGRVQYRVAQQGEVLAAGGRVLNMIDINDVYMTFFLPTTEAGRIATGAEVRLVLDAFPQFVIPAKASFVAAVAQFTPKTVETADERQKLMFRIKARIDPPLLRKHNAHVKTGVPGVAYVRLDERAEWPANLQIKLPQ